MGGFFIDIDAADLVNRGIVSSGFDLVVDTQNLVNEATLFAGDSMQLRVRQNLRNEADASILAVYDLLLAGNAAGGRSYSIVNDLGTIQTLYGDIAIYADRFEKPVSLS